MWSQKLRSCHLRQDQVDIFALQVSSTAEYLLTGSLALNICAVDLFHSPEFGDTTMKRYLEKISDRFQKQLVNSFSKLQ